MSDTKHIDAHLHNLMRLYHTKEGRHLWPDIQKHLAKTLEHLDSDVLSENSRRLLIDVVMRSPPFVPASRPAEKDWVEVAGAVEMNLSLQRASSLVKRVVKERAYEQVADEFSLDIQTVRRYYKKYEKSKLEAEMLEDHVFRRQSFDQK